MPKGAANITWDWPLKGVHKNNANRKLPAGYCPDALNVLPYDAFSGRARGAQRPGTDNTNATPLASGVPVQQMIQTSIPLDPASITADQTLFTEPFTYANGALVGQSRWLLTAASTGTATIASNALVMANNVTAYYAVPLSLGPAWIVKVTFKVNSHTGSVYAFSLNTRVAGDGTNGVAAQVSLDDALLKLYADASLLTSVALPAVDDGANHTLEVRCNGNVFKVYIDSVLKITQTTAVGAGRTGVALGTGTTGSISVNFDNFQVLTGKNLLSYRQQNLVAIAGGNVYQGDPTALTLATNGTGKFVAGGAAPQLAYTTGKVYGVDGVSIVVHDVATATVGTYAATAGTAPTKCTLACVWRDRLVLAAPTDNLQNFFCSRSGVQTDWDYAPAVPDAGQAFAGNLSTAGRIGDPITTLLPFSDDTLLIATDHSLYRIDGDPAAEGSVNLVSDTIGIAGPDAWARDPLGTVYFVGQGGLYRMPAGGAPENLASTTYPQFFASIDRNKQYVTLEYDIANFGLWIFVTPVNEGAATHLFYDLRNGGLWPQQFPTSHGPVSAIVWDADLPSDRRMLMGGRDGYVRFVTTTSYNDDGSALSSYVLFPVSRPAGDGKDAKIIELQLDLGESPGGGWNVAWTLQAAEDHYAALNNPDRTATGTSTAGGRQANYGVRIGGGAFALKLANSTIDKFWCFERAVARVVGAGRQR